MESLFPQGLRVLVVDDDATCLNVIGRMLQLCKYKVTSCNQPHDALTLLRKQRGSFDLVITDIRMPGMDGFKLLEHVELEIDLPVIMISADSENETMMKCLSKGACFYLVKPVRMDQVMTIWQHVIRRKKEKKIKGTDQAGSVDDDVLMKCRGLPVTMPEEVEQNQVDEGEEEEEEDGGFESSVNEGNYNYWHKKETKKRKKFAVKEEDLEGEDDKEAQKKPRVLWTSELHDQFITAITRIGIDRAVPKKILEFMKVPGLTRENVASHLQKYRLYLKRVEEAAICAAMGTKPQNRLPIKSIFGSIPSQLIMNPNDHRISGFPHHQIPHPPFALHPYQAPATAAVGAPVAMAGPPLLPPMNPMIMTNPPLLRFGFDQHHLQDNQLMHCYENDGVGIGPSRIPANSSQLSIGVIQQSLASFATFNRNPQMNFHFDAGFSGNATANLENCAGGLEDGSDSPVPELDPFDFLDGTGDFSGPSEIDGSRTSMTTDLTQPSEINGEEGNVMTNHRRRGEDGNIADVLRGFINFSGNDDGDDGLDDFFDKVNPKGDPPVLPTAMTSNNTTTSSVALGRIRRMLKRPTRLNL